MKPRIAVSIPARTVSEASRMVGKARRLGADLAELRLDYLKRGEPVGKLAGSRQIPLIATFRSERNGGIRDFKEGERVDMLLAAAETGFNYVDIEMETKNLNAVVHKLSASGAKTIASYHDFARTPSDIALKKVLQLCRDSGASLCKLVATVRRLEDNLRLLAFTKKASKNGGVICFGMGRLGVQSRILSPFYGAAFTFASLDDERAVASGQIPISRMRRIYGEMGHP